MSQPLRSCLFFFAGSLLLFYNGLTNDRGLCLYHMVTLPPFWATIFYFVCGLLCLAFSAAIAFVATQRSQELPPHTGLGGPETELSR